MELDYEINFAFSDGVGPSDSNGLTGCDETYVIFFHLVNSDKNFLVKAQNDAFDENVTMMGKTEDGVLTFVASSEGGECKITALNSEICEGEMSMILTTHQGYQEGEGTGRVCIHEANENLIAVKVSETVTNN